MDSRLRGNDEAGDAFTQMTIRVVLSREHLPHRKTQRENAHP